MCVYKCEFARARAHVRMRAGVRLRVCLCVRILCESGMNNIAEKTVSCVSNIALSKH